MAKFAQTVTEAAADLGSAARALAFHARLASTPRHGPRIFVYRGGAIGDILCTLPSLDALRVRDPEAYIVYAAFDHFRPLVEMSGLADAVLDAAGYAKWRLLTDRLYDQTYMPSYEDECPTGQPLVHVVDDFARKMGLTLRDRQPRLAIPEDLRERLRPQVEALRRSGPIIAAQVGPTWAVRMWPAEHWAILVRRLAEERDAVVILVGADFHFQIGPDAAARIPGTVDWIGRHSLPETAAVLSLCDLFVGIDSGLLHLAGAVGTPAVGLFGPVDPDLRLPPSTPSLAVQATGVSCLGCHHRMPRLHWKSGCPHDIACMRELSPTAAFDAVCALLRCGDPV